MNLISVQNLGKSFRRYRTEWHRFARWFGLSVNPSEEHWVLRHVGFDIQRGEAVGVVGENGAGKSTLLKMITGTIRPTEGRVEAHGRIGAILELGIGFNADLTGRQNAYFVAGLMGLSHKQIHQAMPGIEAFADIGEGFDNPVRTYSSGMQMRVAFAVVTAIRPDILIVDEALAVGDAAFQRKCFQRIESYRESGTALLLVSHGIETIKTMCNRAIYIKGGVVARIGEAKSVCDQYEKDLFGGDPKSTQCPPDGPVEILPEGGEFDPALIPDCELRYGNGKADILSCWTEDVNGIRVNNVKTGMRIFWRFQARFNEEIDQPIFGMMVKTREGTAIFGTDSTQMGEELKKVKAGEMLDVTFELNTNLAPGTFYLNCGIRANGENKDEFLSRRVDSAILVVTSDNSTTAIVGLAELYAKLSVKRSESLVGHQI
jgi:lipopolysaccharide transport system ATP-binding protein